MLCSWARHFTSTESVSTGMSEWVPPNCWDNLKEFCNGQESHPLESAGVHEYWLYISLTKITYPPGDHQSRITAHINPVTTVRNFWRISRF